MELGTRDYKLREFLAYRNTGIGKSRAKSIKQAWEEQKPLEIPCFFANLWSDTSQCIKLVKKYGLNTKRIIQDQPHMIAEDIDRIGFKTADQIALTWDSQLTQMNGLKQGSFTPYLKFKKMVTPSL